MRDKFSRNIDYMRVSVTDLCNLRCFYCMPEDGVCKRDHGDVLRYEEIARIVEEGAKIGISKIRITGGEPLVRPGIEEFVARVSEIEGIEEVSMTTNGILLDGKAKELKRAGLNRINISMDSLDPDKYRRITRGGSLKRVFRAVNTCLEEGIKPVKINTVILKGINDDEIEDFARLTTMLPVHVRFIELMPVGEAADVYDEYCMSVDEVMAKLPGLVPAVQGMGNGPAKCYAYRGALGTVGFIAALSHNFCRNCNRIRLTADGKIKPCLNSNVEVDLKPALREGKGSVAELFRSAIGQKPEKHHMEEMQDAGGNRRMYQIGG